MEEQQLAQNDNTASASGSGSVITDLSLMENETDDFGRRILQHERETRRAHAEARQPFWRARPKSWVMDHVTDEQHNTGGMGHRRTASAGSIGSDPPLNVPREWGKRSRRRGSWLRRHESEGDVYITETARTEEPTHVDEDSIIPRRTVYTGDGWEAGADMARQSIETTPPSKRRLQRQASSPSSMQHMNTTLADTDDNDFSATSLLASTPAINHRNRKIDELVRREIETVEKRGVTRRTLNQMSEKFSPELPRPSTAPAAETGRLIRRRSAASNKENEAFSENQQNGDPFGLQNITTQAVNFKKSQKPSHSRHDSMNLLKRLARVSSMSPSPNKDGLDAVITRRASDPAEDAIDTKSLDNRATKTNTQQGEKSLKVEFDLPSRLQDIPQLDTMPQGNSEETETKITVRRIPKPSHPKSALEAVVNEAKDGLNAQIGESTIASLENIIDPFTHSSEEARSNGTDAKLAKPPLQASNLISTDEKRALSEDLALERLSQRLNATKTTISDANRGLELVENKIGNAKIADISFEQPPNATPYTDHNGRTICEHCGGCYTSVWRGLWVEFRENFYTWDPKTTTGLRLTWLGTACLIWWTWLIIESTLCSYHCHPRYAVSMVGYGVDPDAPEFPFVIPTLLFRPFRPLWHPIGVFIAWLVSALIQSLVGHGSKTSTRSTTSQQKGGLGAQAAGVPPNANAGKHMTRSMVAGQNWIGTAATATASATQRIVESTVDAVDKFASMWEDGFGPS